MRCDATRRFVVRWWYAQDMIMDDGWRWKVDDARFSDSEVGAFVIVVVPIVRTQGEIECTYLLKTILGTSKAITSICQDIPHLLPVGEDWCLGDVDAGMAKNSWKGEMVENRQVGISVTRPGCWLKYPCIGSRK